MIATFPTTPEGSSSETIGEERGTERKRERERGREREREEGTCTVLQHKEVGIRQT